MDNIPPYYEERLAEIRSGGVKHIAIKQDKVGSALNKSVPLDPPVVTLANVEDDYYEQFFQNWDEIETFVTHLRDIATDAWGERNG